MLLYILQREVQWKQGVVNYMMLYASLLYNTTPTHCTPPPTAPPSAEYPAGQIPTYSANLRKGRGAWHNYTMYDTI